MFIPLLASTLMILTGLVPNQDKPADEPLCVTVEIRMIIVPNKVFEELLTQKLMQKAAEDLLAQKDAPESKEPRGLFFVSDRDVFEILEAAQGSADCNILMAPRLTTPTGETASIERTTERTYVTAVTVHWD